MKHRYIKEQLEETVKKSLSIAQVCRELGIVPIGGNYKTVKGKIAQWEIDTSHFTGQGWNVGKRYKPFKKVIPIEEILVENSLFSTSALRKKLIKEGLKECKCESCGITEWLNKPISFELDHINGVNTDNRLINLRIMCPNCHSQTDTFRGKGIKSYKNELLKKEYEDFKEYENIPNPEKLIKEKPKQVCKICQIEFTSKHKQKFCSRECNNLDKSSSIPSYKDIIDAFEAHKNFLQVGKHFNVSDNAVRKWCIRYGILEQVKMSQ